MSGPTTRQLAGKRKQSAKGNQRAQLQPGDMLQERYRIIGTLGVGGFSCVYQARDMRFASVTRLCAIKEMVNASGSPEVRELARRSFETEASILATIGHSAVPEVYDYFSESDRSYLVMEYIRGKDLEGTLEEHNKPLDPELVIGWALQVCDVLVHLHSHKPQPIVFRDLKPSNIMLDQNGRIRLIDFGIAKVFQNDVKGTMIGTEGYSPPEQYRGEASPAGDVYALGATMHHLLTFKDPRMEPPFSWQERAIHELNPKVTPALNAVIMKCLSYNAKDRYANSMELSEVLKAMQNPAGAAANPVQPPAVDPAQTLPPAAYTQQPPAQPYPPQQMGQQPMMPPGQQMPPGYGYPPQSGQMPPGMYPQQQPGYGNMPQPVQPQVESQDIKPIWTFKCEDEIRSKIAIADNFAYVGAYDNNLYVLHKQDGTFKWKYPATDGIASSPTVYKGDVFIGSVDQNLYCISRQNGRLQWKFKTNGAIYSSPAANYDYVFFGSDDGFFYAVAVQNGRELWKAQSHGAVRSSPHVTDEFIYYGTEGGYIFCVDMRGKVKWQSQAKRAVSSSPTVAEDMVFVGSLDSTVYALDANSGWAIWRTRTSRPIVSSPAVSGEVVYIGCSDGKLYALDIYSGRQIWAYETQGQIASSPAVWQDAVYFGSTDGYIYSLDTKKGKLRWRFRTQGYVISSPVIADGVIYIGSSDHIVYAIPV